MVQVYPRVVRSKKGKDFHIVDDTSIGPDGEYQYKAIACLTTAVELPIPGPWPVIFSKPDALTLITTFRWPERIGSLKISHI